MPLKAVQQRRLYCQIAEQLYDLIASGEIARGDKLPGELDLARDLGVSRPSVREALIVLETAGIIEVVNGAGSFVRPDAAIMRHLPWTMGSNGPGPLEQFRARYVLEPALVAEAARRISDAEIAALEAILARVRDAVAAEPKVSQAHFEFHEKIAFASGNTILANVVKDLLRRNRSEEVWRTVRSRVDTPENLAEGVIFRTKLIETLRKKNAAAARRQMTGHLSRIGEIYFGPDFKAVEPQNQEPSGRKSDPESSAA